MLCFGVIHSKEADPRGARSAGVLDGPELRYTLCSNYRGMLDNLLLSQYTMKMGSWNVPLYPILSMYARMMLYKDVNSRGTSPCGADITLI